MFSHQDIKDFLQHFKYTKSGRWFSHKLCSNKFYHFHQYHKLIHLRKLQNWFRKPYLMVHIMNDCSQQSHSIFDDILNCKMYPFRMQTRKDINWHQRIGKKSIGWQWIERCTSFDYRILFKTPIYTLKQKAIKYVVVSKWG